MANGSLKVSVKDDKGMVLTQRFGFTVEEDDRVLSFDLHEHPDLGRMVLFGDQVFALKYWSRDQLEKGIKILEQGFKKELIERK